VNCPDSKYQYWKSVTKTTGFLMYRYFSEGKENRVNASCIFLNKGGSVGYSPVDRPYILTTGHTFFPVIDGIIVNLEDKISKYNVYINYENPTCNATKTVWGTKLPITLSKVKIGGSASLFGQPSYRNSDDYAFLQSSKALSQLVSYSIVYAGWSRTTILDYPLASLGHPQGDVKRINIEDDEIGKNPFNDFMTLHYNTGISEKGMSGGPVFNKHFQLVGWNTTVEVLSNYTCGDESVSSWAGVFEDLYDNIQDVIDPNGDGLAALSSYTLTLPVHCTNCVFEPELGEVDIDCGGPCKPCYTPYKIVIDNSSEFNQRNVVEAKSSILIDSPSVISASKFDKEFWSGEDVTITKNFEFNNGAVFTMGIKSDLLDDPIVRQCVDYCLYVPNIVMVNASNPNNRTFSITQKGVIRYTIQIWDREGKMKFTAENIDVIKDGYTTLFDPKDLQAAVYYFTLDVETCKGQFQRKQSYFHLFK
jgi:hypothetical protein